jgi:hypothetical protein
MSLAAKIRFLGIAGVGFFADGYLNLCIGLGKLELSVRTWTKTGLTLPSGPNDRLHPF